MNKRRSGLLVVVLALVLLFSVVSMASATQTWYMKDGGSTTTGADNEMQKGSGKGTTYVEIAISGSKIWAADQKVAVDGIDMSGSWSARVRVYAPGAASLQVDIGVLSSGGSFTSKATDTESGTPTGVANWDFSFSPGDLTLAKDEYLALKLTNTHDTNLINIWTKHDSEPLSPSYLIFDNDDPAYPVPELSTLLLTSVGVLMLGGFIIYSRRRTNKDR